MDHQLAEHFFRHEYSRLLATLCGRFGTQNFPLLEDAVQSALLEATARWRTSVPDNPSAWLYRVAGNRVLDQLRRAETGVRVHRHLAQSSALTVDNFIDDQIDARGLQDDVLRLIFVVCHPDLKPRDQIMLALKHLCGLGVGEIARGLLMKPVAVKKQLQRAAAKLRTLAEDFELPPTAALNQRLDSVHYVLYMVFNEGYSCAKGEQVFRMDVCAEAARLCHLLAEHPLGNADTRALLALMMMHAARLPARIDRDGETILLENQDRSRWDRGVIEQADRWLQSAITPPSAEDLPNRFMLEACIAQMHCHTESFEQTPWPAIISCYDVLIRYYDKPVYRMNRAIAVACHSGVERALAELDQLASKSTAVSSPGLLCARAWLLEKANDLPAALAASEEALRHELAPHEWRLINNRRERLSCLITAGR